MNKDQKIFALGDLAEAAQKEIQLEFPMLNPVIGINHGLRQSGYPADLMTIDDFKSRKRIILMIHDSQPGVVGFQLSEIDKDPDSHFENWPLNQVNQSQLKAWIIEHLGD